MLEDLFSPPTWRPVNSVNICWGPFLESPEKFSHPESHSKISKLMITELFYSRILKQTEVLFTQEVSGVYTFPFSDTDELKIALRARKVSGAF